MISQLNTHQTKEKYVYKGTLDEFVPFFYTKTKIPNCGSISPF